MGCLYAVVVKVMNATPGGGGLRTQYNIVFKFSFPPLIFRLRLLSDRCTQCAVHLHADLK